MAHELDYTIEADGTQRKAIFAVGETPWHGEGVVLTEAPKTVDEALSLSGLDWPVELAPCFQSVGNDDYIEVPNTKLVTRTDRNAVLGVVGKSYRPLQNRDAFGILQPLIDGGLASWETGGSLRDGRHVWGLIRFNIDSPIVREVFADEVVPFGLISNAHDGSRKVTLRETPIRVVCANTLGMAERSGGKSLAVRHTVNVEANTTEAAVSMWGGIVERYESVALSYKALKAYHLDTAMFRKLVLDVALPFADSSPDSNPNIVEALRAKQQARRDNLEALWMNGIGHSGDGSAWEAYNAVTQATDHGTAEIFKSGNRLQSLFDGSLATVKQAVLDSLVAVAVR